MLVFIMFFIFLFSVILFTLLFCNIRKSKDKKNTTNNHKVHLKVNVLKYLIQAEFDYETANDKP